MAVNTAVFTNVGALLMNLALGISGGWVTSLLVVPVSATCIVVLIREEIAWRDCAHKLEAMEAQWRGTGGWRG
jgi:hypothetical protein